MSRITCPKCGKEQPMQNCECIQCGVIFNKLLQRKITKKEATPLAQEQHTPAETQKNFIPDIGLKQNMEITILNIIAYVYLILGIGAGIGIILQDSSEISLFIGILVIVVDLITSMLFFVICTLAKKIISIDNSLIQLVKSVQS